MKTYKDFDLKNISWIKIGGKCDDYIEIDNRNELIEVINKFSTSGTKFDVIGWSCNTLFSDEGLKDMTLIKINTKDVEIGVDISSLPKSFTKPVDSRHVVYKDKNITSGFDTSDIIYDEVEGEDVYVKVDSGTGLSYLINLLNQQGIVGLHYFAGIPSSVGAAAINNIHGRPKNFSDYVYALEVIDKNGQARIIPNQEMNYDYDYSILQGGGTTVISVYLKLKRGDKERASRSAVEWAKKKALQPKNSLGSAFHNLTREVQEKLNLPTTGIGYLIEHVLKLSGYRVGGIMIPEQTAPDQPQINKNIIVNAGNGTAEDYYAVISKVWDESYNQLGIKLKSEVHFKGFNQQKIGKFFGESH